MAARSIRRTIAALAVGALAGTALVAAPADAAPPPDKDLRKLLSGVKLNDLLKHERNLQKVSDANGGNRASGLPGYDESVDYIVRQLTKAGYEPEVQQFDFLFAEERSELERITPDPVTFVEGTDFLRNAFDTGTPEGEATGSLFLADVRLDAPGLPPNTSTSGCEAEDFAGMPTGAIALVQRGTCGFAVKVLNAQAAGAAGVVVMNEGQPGRTGLVGMIGDATGLTIPAVFTTFDAGANLGSTPGATVRVEVDFDEEIRPTYNVFAETRRGDDSNVVMAGAHLDGVQAGAGINDNGSGSAALLETAIEFRKINPTNTVRFAWWGAEESGLLGSEHYVANLTQEEIDEIALYLNFDMIASPNYQFGIYDGDNSGGTAPPGFIPPGSAEIEDVFEAFYTERGLPFNDSEFSGRSDYGPFIAVGIPAGGLFTGAEGVKTEEQAQAYGGAAGAAYDPCYHLFCDNYYGDGQDEALYDQLREDYDLVGNLNTFAFDVNADAAATAVFTFAMDTSSLPEAEPAAAVTTARVATHEAAGREAA
ncbi:MAG: M20/M25/M40 family metallo-hydrolase [Jiangellaceae bacterium]